MYDTHMFPTKSSSSSLGISFNNGCSSIQDLTEETTIPEPYLAQTQAQTMERGHRSGSIAAGKPYLVQTQAQTMERGRRSGSIAGKPYLVQTQSPSFFERRTGQRCVEIKTMSL